MIFGAFCNGDSVANLRRDLALWLGSVLDAIHTKLG